MKELYVVILIVVLAWFNGKYDAIDIKVGGYINHNVRVVLRFLFIGALCFYIDPIDIFQYLIMLWVAGAWFWVVFEASINVSLGRGWSDLGKTALTDRFLRWLTRNDPWYALLFRVAILGLSILTYLKYYDAIY